VIPPQNKGPAVAESTDSGSGNTLTALARTLSASPPCRPTIVDSELAQRL